MHPVLRAGSDFDAAPACNRNVVPVAQAEDIPAGGWLGTSSPLAIRCFRQVKSQKPGAQVRIPCILSVRPWKYLAGCSTSAGHKVLLSSVHSGRRLIPGRGPHSTARQSNAAKALREQYTQRLAKELRHALLVGHGPGTVVISPQ